MGVIQQNLLTLALVQNFAGFVIIEPVAFMVFGEHFIQEVGIVILVGVARPDRRRVILNNFLVIVLEQLVPALHHRVCPAANRVT